MEGENPYWYLLRKARRERDEARERIERARKLLGHDTSTVRGFCACVKCRVDRMLSGEGREVGKETTEGKCS